MDRQSPSDRFSLAAHRLAVERLRERPERLVEALGVLRRWRDQAGGPTHTDTYWTEWEQLLRDGSDAVERAVCVATDHAATLRSVSPLGRFIAPAERHALMKQARDAA